MPTVSLDYSSSSIIAGFHAGFKNASRDASIQDIKDALSKSKDNALIA